MEMETQEFYHGVTCCHQPYKAENHQSDLKPSADHFTVEDLLDFSNDDLLVGDAAFDAPATVSTVAVDSCNSSTVGNPYPAPDTGRRSFPDSLFSGDLCVPCDELAELEWLSNFVEESFSSEDLQKLELVTAAKQPPLNDDGADHPESQVEELNRGKAVPGKARSKRARAAPCNWTARGLLSPTTSSDDGDTTSSGNYPEKRAAAKRDGSGRRCLHCATDKTPQWRTGPMGPKTLCNACGVRYKSGRLVPEYRPAASPTFVLTKHSNSHRKVMELRRQKEVQLQAQQQQLRFLEDSMILDDGGCGGEEDYLITDTWASEGHYLV